MGTPIGLVITKIMGMSSGRAVLAFASFAQNLNYNSQEESLIDIGCPAIKINIDISTPALLFHKLGKVLLPTPRHG